MTAADVKLNEQFKRGEFDRYWALAEKHRLPMFFGGQDFGYKAGVAAERHPDLTVIVDHFGVTQSLANPIEGDRWKMLPKVLELAR